MFTRCTLHHSLHEAFYLVDFATDDYYPRFILLRCSDENDDNADIDDNDENDDNDDNSDNDGDDANDNNDDNDYDGEYE